MNANKCHHCKRKLCADKKWKGVAILIVNSYYGNYDVVLGGKERGGKEDRKNRFSPFGGHVESKHNGCVYQAMVDELCEEGKICLHADRKAHSGINMDRVKQLFGQYHTLQTFPMGKYMNTCVFVMRVESLKRAPLNTLIQKHNADANLKWCQREMECVEWVRVADCKTNPNGDVLDVSNYLRDAINQAQTQAFWAKMKPNNINDLIRKN